MLRNVKYGKLLVILITKVYINLGKFVRSANYFFYSSNFKLFFWDKINY